MKRDRLDIYRDVRAAGLRSGLYQAAQLLEADADRQCGGRAHQQRSRDAAVLYGYADRIRSLAGGS